MNEGELPTQHHETSHASQKGPPCVGPLSLPSSTTLCDEVIRCLLVALEHWIITGDVRGCGDRLRVRPIRVHTTCISSNFLRRSFQHALLYEFLTSSRGRAPPTGVHHSVKRASRLVGNHFIPASSRLQPTNPVHTVDRDGIFFQHCRVLIPNLFPRLNSKSPEIPCPGSKRPRRMPEMLLRPQRTNLSRV